MDVRDGEPGESPSAGPVKNPDHPAAGIGQEIAPLDIEKARVALMERVQAAADAGVVQMSVDEQPGQTSTSAPETGTMFWWPICLSISRRCASRSAARARHKNIVPVSLIWSSLCVS